MNATDYPFNDGGLISPCGKLVKPILFFLTL